MRQDTADFRVENADQLAADRDLDVEKLFDGQRIGVFLVHRRDVVETIEIGQRLQIGLRLDQLLGAAMQQADMRVDALDDFTVELEHEAKNAVRCRVLRAEVDVEVADVMLGHGPCPSAHLAAFSSPGST